MSTARKSFVLSDDAKALTSTTTWTAE